MLVFEKHNISIKSKVNTNIQWAGNHTHQGAEDCGYFHRASWAMV